jgi:hypothetical protein
MEPLQAATSIEANSGSAVRTVDGKRRDVCREAVEEGARLRIGKP